MEVRVKLNEGMQFVGTAGSGHSLLMDTAPGVGGSDTAARPMELVLIALGGCTGMDVVSILRKMRVDFADFEVLLEAERVAEHPKVYSKIHLNYHIWGKDIPEDKFKRAIELSQERYCPITHMLKHSAKIEHEYTINPDR